MWDRASQRALGASILAFACGAAAFARSIAFGFVYDDHWTIEGAPLDMPLFRLMSLLLRGAGKAHHVPDETRPVMVASMWLDHALFRETPSGYHADSVLLYGVVSVAALWACFALSSRIRVAAVGALFFALAPLHTEVVCAINYREDLLASMGVLAALLVLLQRRRPTRIDEVVALGAFAFGLLAKESAAVLAPLVVGLAAISPKARQRVLAKRELLVGLVAVLVLWFVWRGGLAARGDDVPRAHFASASARVFASARFFVRESIVTLFPFWALPEHARESPASAVWLVALVVWILAIVLLARKRVTRTPAVGLAIALVAPLPASPLFGPTNEFADRYAFLGVLGAGLVWGWIASRAPRRLSLPLIVAGSIAMWIACQSSAAPWRNDRALWSRAVRDAPTSPRAWVGLSRACRLDGDIDEADRDVDHAIALDPKFVSAHVTRAYNDLWRGDVTGARGELVVIHALGGDRRSGVAKVTECAELPPERTRACIR